MTPVPPADVLEGIVARGSLRERTTPESAPARRAPRRWHGMVLRPVAVGGALALAVMVLVATQISGPARGPGLLDQAAAAMSRPDTVFHYLFDLRTYGTTKKGKDVSHLRAKREVWLTSDGRALRSVSRVPGGKQLDVTQVHDRLSTQYTVPIHDTTKVSHLRRETVDRCWVPRPLSQQDVGALIKGAALDNGDVRLLSQKRSGGRAIFRIRVTTELPPGCPRPYKASLEARVVLDAKTFLPKSVLVLIPPTRDQPYGVRWEYVYTNAEDLSLDQAARRGFRPSETGELGRRWPTDLTR